MSEPHVFLRPGFLPERGGVVTVHVNEPQTASGQICLKELAAFSDPSELSATAKEEGIDFYLAIFDVELEEGAFTSVRRNGEGGPSMSNPWTYPVLVRFHGYELPERAELERLAAGLERGESSAEEVIAAREAYQARLEEFLVYVPAPTNELRSRCGELNTQYSREAGRTFRDLAARSLELGIVANLDGVEIKTRAPCWLPMPRSEEYGVAVAAHPQSGAEVVATVPGGKLAHWTLSHGTEWRPMRGPWQLTTAILERRARLRGKILTAEGEARAELARKLVGVEEELATPPTFGEGICLPPALSFGPDEVTLHVLAVSEHPRTRARSLEHWSLHATVGGAWSRGTAPSDEAQPASAPALAVGRGALHAVVRVDGNELRHWTLTGQGWQAQPHPPGGAHGRPSLAYDAAKDELLLLVREEQAVRALRWSEGAWSEEGQALSGVLTDATATWDPRSECAYAVAVDPSGACRASKREGGSWEALPPSPAKRLGPVCEGLSQAPAAACDQSGRLHVAYREVNNASSLCLLTYDSGWSEDAEVSDGVWLFNQPALAPSAKGRFVELVGLTLPDHPRRVRVLPSEFDPTRGPHASVRLRLCGRYFEDLFYQRWCAESRERHRPPDPLVGEHDFAPKLCLPKVATETSFGKLAFQDSADDHWWVNQVKIWSSCATKPDHPWHEHAQLSLFGAMVFHPRVIAFSPRIGEIGYVRPLNRRDEHDLLGLWSYAGRWGYLRCEAEVNGTPNRFAGTRPVDSAWAEGTWSEGQDGEEQPFKAFGSERIHDDWDDDSFESKLPRRWVGSIRPDSGPFAEVNIEVGGIRFRTHEADEGSILVLRQASQGMTQPARIFGVWVLDEAPRDPEQPSYGSVLIERRTSEDGEQRDYRLVIDGQELRSKTVIRPYSCRAGIKTAGMGYSGGYVYVEVKDEQGRICQYSAYCGGLAVGLDVDVIGVSWGAWHEFRSTVPTVRDFRGLGVGISSGGVAWGIGGLSITRFNFGGAGINGDSVAFWDYSASLTKGGKKVGLAGKQLGSEGLQIEEGE